MKIIQLTKNKTSIDGWSWEKNKIVHVGIEHFHSLPLYADSFKNDEPEKMFLVNINNKLFYINECDIIEFDDFNYTSENASQTPPLPGISNEKWDNNTFITIGYEEVTT